MPSSIRVQSRLAAPLAVALLLCLPATSVAAGGASESQSVSLLARGAGYEIEGGSKPVRALQRGLRRVGHEPGPIDGLYGPLTEAAVEGYQQAEGLPVDGVAGPQTRDELTARLTKRRRAERERRAGRGPAERPAAHGPDRGAASPRPAGAEPEPERAPQYLAALAALAAGLLITVLWALKGRRRERRRPRGARPNPEPARRTERGRAPEAALNLGVVCAALLAVFALGAAGGAVFATRAAPTDGAGAIADSGALLAPRQEPGSGGATVARRQPRRSGAAHVAGRRPARSGAGQVAGRRPTRSGAGQLARRRQARGRRTYVPDGPPGDRSRSEPSRSTQHAAARRSMPATGRAGAGGSEDARLGRHGGRGRAPARRRRGRWQHGGSTGRADPAFRA
jgi:hypothetical protein